MSENWLPLEMRLKEFAEHRKGDFANQHVDYWTRYTALLSSLNLSVYPNINAGLSCLSKSPGIYTDHGGRHFDEVVRYAGLLIDDTFNQQNSALTPYELYLLLCAIRVHDAGNIDGRGDHEKRATAILMEYGGQINLDTPERDLIGAIAQAHGGTTIDDDKDTIGRTVTEETTACAVDVRPQLVAALVRFADEICEHSSRAATHHINHDTLPEENKLFHWYAKSIVGVKPDRKNKALKLQLKFDTSLFAHSCLTPKNMAGKQVKKYLIDEVWDRIDKLNHERVYCNRFLLPAMQTDRLEIKMEFTKPETINGAIYNMHCGASALTIRDKGYPTVPSDWKADVSDMTGANFAKKAW
jgi:hypothetical protein